MCYIVIVIVISPQDLWKFPLLLLSLTCSVSRPAHIIVVIIVVIVVITVVVLVVVVIIVVVLVVVMVIIAIVVSITISPPCDDRDAVSTVFPALPSPTPGRSASVALEISKS